MANSLYSLDDCLTAALRLHCSKIAIVDCVNFGQERFLGPEKQMKIGLAQRRVVRGIAFLSVLWSFCSAAIASDAQTYQTAAAVAVSKLDFERAIQIYSKGLEQQFSLKDRAELLRMRGVTAQLAKRWDQAEADFTAAVEMVGSTDPRAYRDRGFFYHHQGRFELALADYTAGAKLFPDNGAFPNGQGLALMEQGKFEEAINRFDERSRNSEPSRIMQKRSGIGQGAFRRSSLTGLSCTGRRTHTRKSTASRWGWQIQQTTSSAGFAVFRDAVYLRQG